MSSIFYCWSLTWIPRDYPSFNLISLNLLLSAHGNSSAGLSPTLPWTRDDCGLVSSDSSCFIRSTAIISSPAPETVLISISLCFAIALLGSGWEESLSDWVIKDTTHKIHSRTQSDGTGHRLQTLLCIRPMLALGCECHMVGTWVQIVWHHYHYNVQVDAP